MNPIRARKVVRFGKVNVREHQVGLLSDSKLELQPPIVNEYTRNVNSLEVERQQAGRLERNRDGDKRSKRVRSQAVDSGLLQRAAERKARLFQEYIDQQNSNKALPPGIPILHHWHLKRDCAIHISNGGHSSTVIEVQGKMIKTASGSRYCLGELDPKIIHVLKQNGIGFNSQEPLSAPYDLLLAESIVYGKASLKYSFKSVYLDYNQSWKHWIQNIQSYRMNRLKTKYPIKT
jgi:hypothetical protein